MTVTANALTTEIDYPTGDGQPVAETYAHLYAIFMTLEVLRQYLSGQRAVVLGNQFLYYEKGQPQQRIAPDVFVCFDVDPDGRDNYKVWEEGSVPAVAFEMTSPGTRDEDEGFKKNLYAQIGIQEYWQFDPKGEWIPDKLRGYCLVNGEYQSITDNISLALRLRLEVDDAPRELPMRNYRVRSRRRRKVNPPPHSSVALIAFYRLDTGEKLLRPEELKAEAIAAQQQASKFKAEAIAAQQQASEFKAEAIAAQQQASEFKSEAIAAQQQASEFKAKAKEADAFRAELAEYKAHFGSLDK
jgi:Uma2 family endonuclease